VRFMSRGDRIHCASDLPPGQLDSSESSACQPRLCWKVSHGSARLFVKSHDPYLVLMSGRPLKYPIAILWFIRVEEKKDREWRPALL
jgi:hypothetical protein